MPADEPVRAGAEDVGEDDKGGFGGEAEVGFEEVRDAGCHGLWMVGEGVLIMVVKVKSKKGMVGGMQGVSECLVGHLWELPCEC